MSLTDLIEALDIAKEAVKSLEANDGDNYDPCGDVQRRVEAEYIDAEARLRSALRSFLGLHSSENP